jgi:hypothetical protein
MMAKLAGSRINYHHKHHHSDTTDVIAIHEQCYLMSELESLGLSTIRLNEFNNNTELRNLVHSIKQSEPLSSKKIVTKNQYVEELRSLGIRIRTRNISEIPAGEQELADVVRIVKYALYNAYKTIYGRCT